jgi:hypothetical protein
VAEDRIELHTQWVAPRDTGVSGKVSGFVYDFHPLQASGNVEHTGRGSLEVPTRKKTNSGKGSTILLIREGQVPNLCALRVYIILQEEALKRV